MHHLLIWILAGTRSELKGRGGLGPWPSIAHYYPFLIEDEEGNTHCTLKTRDEWKSIVSEYASKVDFPVILATDYQNNTFDHDGKYMTYDDWNMPADLQAIIKTKRSHFEKVSPDVFETQPWHLTESNFNV